VISRLAGRQRGVVARWQLLAAGVTRNQIDVRVAAGRLHEIHRGVYLVGHEVAPLHAAEAAAVLACHGHATISHESSAVLWELTPYRAPTPIRVTVSPERRLDRLNLHIHRATLAPGDICRRHGLPLTSPPRAILELAGSLELGELEHLIAEAHYRKLASDAELRQQVARNPGRRGVRRLRAVLELPGGPRRTRSPAERELLGLLRRANVTGYETNARIHGFEVDFLWRKQRLVVEVDGFDGHCGRVAFERDRLKAATLIARGLRVMHVTGRQVRRDPDGVLARNPAHTRRNAMMNP
jgi:very-short-patch-repair endonuclease